MIVDQKVNKPFVGAYLIDGDVNGTQLTVTKAPSKLQRFFFRILLGWKWASLKELKKKDENKPKEK